jgi:hypothetical protein
MPDKRDAAGEDSVVSAHEHYHQHPQIGHSHPHIHLGERQHHGPAFGKLKVVEVEEVGEPPEVIDFALVRQLRDSIAAEEAKRREQ